jgi:hypothetical protein
MRAEDCRDRHQRTQARDQPGRYEDLPPLPPGPRHPLPGQGLLDPRHCLMVGQPGEDLEGRPEIRSLRYQRLLDLVQGHPQAAPRRPSRPPSYSHTVSPVIPSPGRERWLTCPANPGCGTSDTGISRKPHHRDRSRAGGARRPRTGPRHCYVHSGGRSWCFTGERCDGSSGRRTGGRRAGGRLPRRWR